jgi:hypothetical protein
MTVIRRSFELLRVNNLLSDMRTAVHGRLKVLGDVDRWEGRLLIGRRRERLPKVTLVISSCNLR